MFDQVKIDLTSLNENFFQTLDTSQIIKNAAKLEQDWESISNFWKAQPAGNMLSIFVTVY